MSVLHQIIESLPPSGVEHPVEGAVTLAATALAMAKVRRQFNRTEEKVEADFPNAALLETIATQTPDQVRRTRLGPLMCLLAGTGAVAACAVAHPTYETSQVDSQANTILVQDVSNAMDKTHDLGDPRVTRSAAVTYGIQTSKYPGKLGIIHTAADYKLMIPLSSDWERHRSRITVPDVDQNGGKLTPALRQAETELPISRTDPGKREGTVIAVTDGIVDDTPESIAAQASRMEKDGVKLEFIVPGTGTGTYKITPTAKPTPAQAKPELFAGLKNVRGAQTVDQVVTAVKQELNDAGTDRHKAPWYPAFIGSLAVFAVGLARITKQHATRWT